MEGCTEGVSEREGGRAVEEGEGMEGRREGGRDVGMEGVRGSVEGR